MVDLGLQLGDPLWHMPLWAPYRAGIESSIGHIVNTGRTLLAYLEQRFASGRPA